jgi:hypothetical protein
MAAGLSVTDWNSHTMRFRPNRPRSSRVASRVNARRHRRTRTAHLCAGGMSSLDDSVGMSSLDDSVGMALLDDGVR